MKALAKYCVEHGYKGYEGMIDLPGTVAGAVVNNSGCYGCGVEDTLKSIDIVKEDGEIYNLSKADLNYSYRNSALKKGILKGVIIKAYFDISKHDSPEKLKLIAGKNHQDRITTQDPPAHNLGSTVNVSGDYKGFRGTLLRTIRRIMILFKVSKARMNHILPYIVCSLYGCPSVAKYISKKRLGCFIWKDKEADAAFTTYISMMHKLFRTCSTEIEILNNVKC